ncbi:RNA-binding protein [Gemmobacter nectariphilus]|uniref:RNA-binding protein n=1 Tax=Gemmobacter nectariphilus TaxID=220343 RepID=UPI000420CE1F|nr:RNA-binding protein [Gemmobacter nectariphilus]
MTRGGRDKDGTDPERKCIATGESQPKGGLIRFVAGPDGQVVPDLLGKLPGRGFYVAADKAALDKAVAKNLFSRAARTQLTIAPDLVALVDAGLARRVVDLIAMARKAGQAVAGLEKVKDWLEKDQAEVLIQAFDGSERERGRLRPPRGPDSLIGCLSAQELGLAFGRERAIHGALAAGGLERRVVEEAARLAGLRKVAQASGKQFGGRTAGKDTKTA